MAIQPANTNDGIDEDDGFKEEVLEGTSYNMRELMDQVYQNNDIIFTVPEDDVAILKKGLIVRKGKDNAKVKDSGLRPDGLVLSFNIYPAKDSEGKEKPGLMDVRVKLGPKKAVQVLDIRVPDTDF